MSEICSRVEAAVARALTEHALWPAGATVVAAVSGGPDSLCLLGALQALRARGHPLAPGALVVAHLEHGLRGAAGEADARFVAEVAAALGLRSVLERAAVAAEARATHRSLEDAARRVRYAFLRRVAAELAAEAGERGTIRIATGHTRDDQVETLVLHWLRGSGLTGLGGMAPLTGDLARPLLTLTRAETEGYCAARGWQPRTDATNADPRYVRNRIRHHLLPALEGYNPNLRTALVRNAALLAADEAYLDARGAEAWEALSPGVAPTAITLDLERLRALPLALRHRAYRRAARHLAGHDYPLEARHIALLDGLLAGGRNGHALDLPEPLRALRGYATLTITRREAASTAAREVNLDRTWPLPVPGTVELPELGWRVRAWLREGPPGLDTSAYPPPPELPAFAHAGDEGHVGHAVTRVYLAPEAAAGALTVRAWRPGDRFRPLGMTAEKKLQDYFADAKVPRPLRSRLPLVFGPDHLLWITGLRIDDRARLPTDATHARVLQLEPLDSNAPDGALA
ncbi:MAG: tRNA lysidine(34) synthetase TilS [Ktedonobacterales bacterium]|nr:tRNA lysidine(34) synthetase TilS [Ktedonobacterales bacterium]